MRAASSVLPIGAQSSLTGGATPRGEVLLSTSRLNRILASGDDWVRVEAGVTLVDLDAALAAIGKHYPPVPTFTGAFVGGVVATNAAGAATFKYGTTRDWVRALTVVLANGDVLDIERGRTRAHPDGFFEIVLSDRAVRVPVPRYRMPDVPKVSAGYFAAPGMDLIDLFIGSEGTLGVITEVTLRVLPERPAMCLAFVPFGDRDRRARVRHAAARRGARDLAHARSARDGRLGDRAHGRAMPRAAARGRRRSRERRRHPRRHGDGAARHAGAAARHDAGAGVRRDRHARASRTRRTRRSSASAGRSTKPACSTGSRSRCPETRARERQLLALREAVPAGVNARVGRAQAGGCANRQDRGRHDRAVRRASASC